MRCVRQRAATIQQRIFERLRQRVVRAVIGIGLTETKEATAVATAQRCQQIIEADADESGPLD